MPRAVAIVELDHGSLGPHVTLRRPGFAHEWVAYDVTHPADVSERIRGAAVVVTNKVAIGRELLAEHPGVRLIAVAATGVDVVDLAAASEFGVDVVNVRRYAEDSVPEHTFALLLALARQLPIYREAVSNGVWQESEHFCFFAGPVRTLAGKTLGLVGFGSLARRVADIALAFGMRVIVSTPRPPAAAQSIEFVSLEHLLANADVVSLHCPLTDPTRGMINARTLAAMRPDALLINTARGGLIDEAALAEALCTGAIGGAALDVLSTEPPAPDNPLLQLAKRPNLIITPHVAWASAESVQRLADQLIELIEAWHRGKPRHLVTSS